MGTSAVSQTPLSDKKNCAQFGAFNQLVRAAP